MSKINPIFSQNQYTFRRKFFRIFGGEFHVYDSAGKLAFYSKQKAFRLREDIRIFSDESMSKELIAIKTPNIIDAWATYNITDSETGEMVGSLRRKLFMSMFKDEWVLLSPAGQEIGKMVEESWLSAFLARVVILMPQTYNILSADNRLQAVVSQHFNPVILKYTMSILPGCAMDRRLIVTAGILLTAIERRQDND